MVANKTLVYKKLPTGLPQPGEHLVIEDRPLDIEKVPSGGLVVEVLSVSLDPYLRGKMRDVNIVSYTPPLAVDSPIENSALARVIKSDAADFKEGDVAVVFVPLAEYAVIPSEALGFVRKILNPLGLPVDYFLGPLGMPGITAYSGLYKIGKPQKGETLFVDSAAGAVGQVVGQIAKQIGLKVLGSVGSDEKLEFITKELGFDGGFNYKKEKPSDALDRLAPQGIDIFFENVGGEHFEAALNHMNLRGRIIVCGMIDSYNATGEERYGVRNLFEIVAKRITMTGFIQGDPDFAPVYREEFTKNVSQWIADGSFSPKLHITKGIDNAAEAFLELFNGKNFGKAIVKIKD